MAAHQDKFLLRHVISGFQDILTLPLIAGGIRVVGSVYPGKPIVDVILGKHELTNSFEVFRLVLLHPQQFRGGKAREGNIGRVSV